MERILRPLRSVAESTATDRVKDGLCILQPKSERPADIEELKGFSSTEILDSFGGEDFLSHCCGRCDANRYSAIETETRSDPLPRQFAGCYGYLQGRYDEIELFEDWESFLRSPQGTKELGEGFRLYRLWQSSEFGHRAEMGKSQRAGLLKLLNRFLSQSFNADLFSFARAIQSSLDGHYELTIRAIPAGKIIGRTWIVPEHCSNCIVEIERWKGQCPNCKSKEIPNPMRKRQLKGDRPYWPLYRFLGIEGAQ